jgi:hypothetical protein
MAKNLIPEIAKMLGVELGEEFKFGNNNVKFWFDLDGLHSEEFETADLTFYRLARGDAEIVKLPWKPKEGQTVYSFYARGISRSLEVISFVWVGSVVSHQALVKAGWVFPTREEAEAALPAVAAGIGVEYEL